MRSFYRLLLILTTIMIVLPLLAGAVAFFLASRSLPDYNADLVVAGITSPVEIVRDSANVPHISAAADRDIFFGLGFAHAQDRLWQMTLLRRMAQGRLSEIFGPDTLETDIFLRRLDLQGIVSRSEGVQDAATQEALSAYAEGVNAWLGEINRSALGRGAPEFFLFGSEVAAWQPTDSLAIAKLLALQQSPGPDGEILRARLSMILPSTRLEDLLPATSEPVARGIEDYTSLFPSLDRRAAVHDPQPRNMLFPVSRNGLAAASNAWAVGPSRTVAAVPMLANDPHSAFTLPSQWYLADLQLSSGAVIGATVPGVPFIMLGRSDRFGWGMTASYMDDLDIHVEKVNPEDPKQVLTPDGYKDVLTRDTIIEVKGMAPVTITLQWTENGPVIPSTMFGLQAILPKGHMASFAWSVLAENDATPSAMLRLMTAQSVEDGIEAGAIWTTPAVNLVLADTGAIALQMVGQVPQRSSLHQTQGQMPSPGWLERNRWQDALPYELNPREVNPSTDLLGNTNNRTTDRAFPKHLAFEWGDAQRIRRLRSLLADAPVHTRESFIAVQLDTVSETARTLLPLLGQELWFTTPPAAQGTSQRRRQEALDLLANWNGDMNEHRSEPLIYAAWLRALQARILSDELGPLAEYIAQPSPVFLERVFRDVNGASLWCDIQTSTAVESCKEISVLALDEALLWIEETFGAPFENLQWGEAHVARLDNPVLGRLPFLGWFLNLRLSLPGDGDTLMRASTSATAPNPFVSVSGTTYRGIYDFADPDASLFINSTGQSGHPLSRFYDDQSVLWQQGGYIPMSTDLDLARAGAAGVTRLKLKR